MKIVEQCPKCKREMLLLSHIYEDCLPYYYCEICDIKTLYDYDITKGQKSIFKRK